MTSPALIERITRSLAYMLRHQPERFDLELDAHGYGTIDDVLRALIERLGETVTREDLEVAVGSGDRPRYEIVGDRIRALYGHSIDVEPGESTRPPERLYVGISSRDADRAMRNGLRGGRRRFLHLALTAEDARESGRRSGREYSVLAVFALDAWESGISFYDRKSLFLAEQIPTQYLELSGQHDDGFERPLHEGGGRYDEPRRERGRQRDHGHGGHGGHGREREHAAPEDWHDRESSHTLEPVAASPREEFDGPAPSAERDRDMGRPEERGRAPQPSPGGREDRGDRGQGRHGGRGRGRDERRPAQGGGRPWRERDGGRGFPPREERAEPPRGEQPARVEPQRGEHRERPEQRERIEHRDRGGRERFERGGERPQRREREVPRPEPAPAPARLTPASSAPEGPSFGTGIFEAPPAAPKPPPPREPVPLKEPPRRKEPEREASSGSSEPGSGFGAGI